MLPHWFPQWLCEYISLPVDLPVLHMDFICFLILQILNMVWNHWSHCNTMPLSPQYTSSKNKDNCFYDCSTVVHQGSLVVCDIPIWMQSIVQFLEDPRMLLVALFSWYRTTSDPVLYLMVLSIFLNKDRPSAFFVFYGADRFWRMQAGYFYRADPKFLGVWCFILIRIRKGWHTYDSVPFNTVPMSQWNPFFQGSESHPHLADTERRNECP